MPPRIRSLLPRLPFARESKSPAREAPQVFREFVETLQRLDAPAPPVKRAQRMPARKRRYEGNGHKRPSTGRARSRMR
jgi:hypothetical protein